MAKRNCSVEGCDRAYRCSGYCGLHYDRVRRTGSPHLPAKPTTCTVAGCGRGVYVTDKCRLHYDRLMKTGSVGTAGLVKFTTTLDSDDVVGRIMERTERRGDCIVWTGYAIPSGYGLIHWREKSWVVHRAMWTAINGAIPEGDEWTIDHLCRVKRCVNVKHMEVVTRTENSLRAGGLAIAQGRNKQRNAMACRNGHERTASNTTINKHGIRQCLDCRKSTWARNSAAANAKRRAEYAARAERARRPRAALRAGHDARLDWQV